MSEFVHRFWKVAVVVALVVVAVLLFRQKAHANEEEAEAQAWDKLLQAASTDPQMGLMSGKPADLVAVADQIKDAHAGAFALYVAAASAARQQDYAQAKSLLTRLRQEFPSSAIVADKLSSEPGAAKQSDVDVLESRVDAWLAWRQKNPSLFGLPDLPPDAPKVKINTDRGTIVVGLYTAQAPLHAEAFLKLARDGSFNGMKFHRVQSDRLIQSGDPNTLKEDVTAWGAGELGSAPAAESNDLKHFAGALATARATGSKSDSGSQFVIVITDDFPLDANSVVFGKVIEGLDLAKAISESKTVEGTERPEQPATIQSTEVP